MNQTTLTAYGTALLRITLGGFLLIHGLIKLLLFTPAGTVQFFCSLGLPPVTAYLVMGGEILGGLALIAGFWTRWAALAALPILMGAIVPHSGNGFMFSNTGGGWEFPVFWAIALVVQALLGDGAFAVSGRNKAVQA